MKKFTHCPQCDRPADKCEHFQVIRTFFLKDFQDRVLSFLIELYNRKAVYDHPTRKQVSARCIKSFEEEFADYIIGAEGEMVTALEKIRN